MSEARPKTQPSYTAALIVIGNEILSGRTQDTNLGWIAEQLGMRGIVLKEARTVRDVEDEIAKAINELRAEADYVFTTGGIGPTHDDITTASVAKAFGVEVVENPDALSMLKQHYSDEEINDARRKMAHTPDGAVLIHNPVSAAPGFQLENVYVLAGVPRIMQAMFDNIIDSLAGGAPVLSNTITCQLKESDVAPGLGQLQKDFPDIDMGSYPHFRSGIMGLSLVLRGTDDTLLRKATDQAIAMIRDLGDEPRAMTIRS